MTDLSALETLFDITQGPGVPLPQRLADFYGGLCFPEHTGRPHVFANFVATLDGVVSLGLPGKADGGEISGFNPHDQMVMGLLRATADAVVIGAGTLHATSPDHLWTADYIYPPLADEFLSMRATLEKPEPPVNVVVSATDDLDLERRVFQSGEVPVLIITTSEAAKRIGEAMLAPSVHIVGVNDAPWFSARTVLAAVQRVRPCEKILIEGGPRLMGDFFAEQQLDELFLTLAPQVAGRDDVLARPGLVAGKRLAPEHAQWGTLVGLKRGGSHLFLRYRFPVAA